MGTRHIIKVIDANGVTKVSQYGQWDGYPTGQGIDILHFLRVKDNLEGLSLRLKDCTELTPEQSNNMNKAIHAQALPGFTNTEFGILFSQSLYNRDLGSKILYRIAYAPTGRILLRLEKVDGDTWCEFEYDINYQTGYLSVILLGGRYHGKKVASWRFDSLPSDEDMERLEACIGRMYSDNEEERRKAMEDIIEFQG